MCSKVNLFATFSSVRLGSVFLYFFLMAKYMAIFIYPRFTFIVLTSLLIVSSFANENDDEQDLWNRAMRECCEKYNFTEGQIWDKWEIGSSFGENNDWKGWINCWYHGIGVMDNYEIKVDEQRRKIKSERNKQKFDKCLKEAFGTENEDKAYIFADCVGREKKENDEQDFPQASRS